ncbi:MAG: AAA family ATPase [Candidatus Methanodesulfokora sp.]
MLFDPKPKTSRDVLFDRDKELDELQKLVMGPCPLILCLGIRRIGKTSLVKTFINEVDYPSIYINAIKLSEYNYSRNGFFKILSEEFTRSKGKLARAIEHLRGIRGVTIGGYGVEFDLMDRDLSLSSILERLSDYALDKGTTFLVVIDEAQELRFLRGYGRIDFRKILAQSYDNLRGLKFILTGSEVGLLYKFLELENYESPLYGRIVEELMVERFSAEKSIEFLEAGFSEVGMKVQRSFIEEAVDRLDGIPGWLAFYGYEVLRSGRQDILNFVVEKATSLARAELGKLVKSSRYYGHILKAVALGYGSWSTIKSFVELRAGRKVDNKALTRWLKRLVDLSILTKRNDEYEFLDPIHKEAAKRL